MQFIRVPVIYPRLSIFILAIAWVGNACADVQVPVPTAKAIALSHQLDLYWLAEKFLTLLIPLLVLFSGWGSHIRTACSLIARGRRFWIVALFACAYLIFTVVFSFPFNYARHFALPHSLGLTQESLGQWLGSQAIRLMVMMVAATLFVWIPYWILQKSPQRWWLWSAGALVPVALLILVVKPIWVDPLTTTYKPLENKPLEAEIKALAARCGVVDIPVLIGGDDTTVVGLGPTNRIVLQEDLFKTETEAQIRFTIGHELKHYVMGDNWKALLIISALLLVGFWLTHYVSRWVIARWHRRFGFDALADPASLPLAVFCMTFLWLAVTPIFLAFNQHIEREADRFGLELTHENEAAAGMFAKWLARDIWIADPGWLEQTFRSTHPSLGDRIRMANEYHPWTTGMPLFYGKEFTPSSEH
jgi:STE24 endopeptidase